MPPAVLPLKNACAREVPRSYFAMVGGNCAFFDGGPAVEQTLTDSEDEEDTRARHFDSTSNRAFLKQLKRDQWMQGAAPATTRTAASARKRRRKTLHMRAARKRMAAALKLSGCCRDYD